MIKVTTQEFQQVLFFETGTTIHGNKTSICCSNSYSGEVWKFAAFVKVGYHCILQSLLNFLMRKQVHTTPCQKKTKSSMPIGDCWGSLYIPFALHTLENQYVQIA